MVALGCPMVCRSMGEGGCADGRSCFLVMKVTGRSFAILAQGTWSYGLLVVPLPFWPKERGAMHPATWAQGIRCRGTKVVT